MSATWRCGDCGAVYDKSVFYCERPLEDYLSLRGGSIESAISGAVDEAIAPLVERALRRLNGVRTWQSGNAYRWRWSR